jgi:hypothetical protein
MSGTGRGQGVYIVGYNNGLPVYASEGSHLQISSSYPKVKNLGRFQVRTTATSLPDCSCSSVIIRAKEGNLGNIWIGGVDEDVPAVNVGMPLHEDESIILYVNNTNKIRLIAASDYDEVYVIAYLDAEADIELTPGNPPPPDLTAPTVTSRFPAPGATGIATNTAIYAIFDEELLGATITTTNITVSPSITYTVSKDSVDPTKVLVVPASNLAFSTLYTITLTSGLTDDADTPNALVGPVAWSFTTTNAPPPPDTTPPTIISVTPTDESTNVAVAINPAVSFSEDLLDSSVTSTTIKLVKVSNSQEITANRTHSSDGKTITITPESSLEYSTEYRLDITGGSTGVKDVAGNALAASASYTFTTEAQALTATYSVSGNTYINLNVFGVTRVGEYLNTNSSILKNGRPFKKFILYFRKKGNPSSDTVSIAITNSTGSTVQSLGSFNITSLSTSSDTTKTYEITGHTFSQGQMVLVSYDGGDSDNGLYVRISNTNATSDGSATCLRKYYGFIYNTWSNDTSSDVAGLFYS